MHSVTVLLLTLAEGQEEATGLKGLYEKLGWPFFVNMAVVVFVLATIAERAIYLTSKFKVNSRELLAQVKKLVQAGNIDRAVTMCKSNDMPVLRVFLAGLMNVNRGEDAVVQAIDEQLIEVEPLVMKRVPWFWSLANIGTLFGLLGTILGLIHTFSSLDKVTDPGKRQAALARGISEAMYNTALGLGIALICMVADLVFRTMTKRIMSEVESTTTKLTNLLTQKQQA